MTKRRKMFPPNVTSFLDRHGKTRFRYRKAGRPALYLPGFPGSPEFDSAYKAASGGEPLRFAPRGAPGSVHQLIARFYASTTFLGAGADRQRTTRGIIESFRAEYGDDLVADFRFDHIEAILVRKSRKRTGARGRTVGGLVASASLKKQLRRLFAYAVKLGWIATSPVDLAEGVRQIKGGFHSWSEEEIAQYRARHPLGTKARLWAEIILWTWQRKGDAHRFGPGHMKGERIQYTQAKGGKVLWLPAAPQLLAAIKAMPAIGLTTYLVTDYGKPFGKAGIGNKMREWCDQAGLPHCTSHGLRKAAARRAADLEATSKQLMAAGGWSNSAEVDTYTADADQARLAAEIITRVADWELANL